MDWVIALATNLRANGVDAILDKWHLREGQDAHAFMERMVVDEGVGKVALICDAKYAERADKREGGVGVESQIISAELYGKVNQTKFVAIAREKDQNGRAILPVFMGSRIYIDLTQDAEYAQGFEQLLRWCFDKPIYIEPELGTPPPFLDDQSRSVVGSATEFQRVARLAAAPVVVNSAAAQFLRQAADSSADFTLELSSDEPPDELVFQGIMGTAPVASRILEIVEQTVQASSEPNLDLADECHLFLEKVYSHYNDGDREWSGDATKFFGQFILVGLIAVFIRNRKFAAAERLLATPFLRYTYTGMTAEKVHYTRLRQYLKSLETRNQRLSLRRISVEADLIKDVCSNINFSFVDFMQADFVLFLRGVVKGDEATRWWPASNIFVADRGGEGVFPWFLRAEATSFRDPFLAVMEVLSNSDWEQMISKFRSGAAREPAWSGSFARLDVLQLANAEAISQSF